MNITNYPIKPIKTEKLVLTEDQTAISTKSQPCIMSVVSGNVFLAGKRDDEVSSDSFVLTAGDDLRFFGDIALCSDSDGADVRLLYYDVI